LTFKAAYVRHTIDHEVIASSVYGFAALSLVPFILKAERNKIAKIVGMVSVAAIMFVALPLSLPLNDVPLVVRYPMMLIQNALVIVQQTGPCLSQLGGNKVNQEGYDKRLGEIREKNQLADVNGTVDLYPCLCNVAIAHGYEYKPRPVFQSYLAYRQPLTKLNDDHLRSDKAANTLIIQEMTDLYGYYPTLYDGPSWPDILSRYEPKSCQPAGLVLSKRAQPLKWELRPLHAQRAKLGDAIEIKDAENKIVFAKINVALTPVGSVQKLFFRVFPPTLETTTSSGEKKTFKAPSEIMKSGFILSPFAKSPEQVQEMFTNKRNSATDVTTFTVAESKNDFAWNVFAPDYTIELYELVVTP